MFFVRLPLFALISSLALLSGSSLLSAAPVVSAQIADQSVYDATPALEIDLNTKFSDPTLPANTVRLTTDLGIIDVTLYDQQTPITVDNFLHYIDSGAYIPNDPNFPVPAPIFFPSRGARLCHPERRLYLGPESLRSSGHLAGTGHRLQSDPK